MWELFSDGKIPYPSLSNKQVVEEVLSGFRLSKPDKCPESMWNIVMKCWEKNPKDRPNFDEIVKMIIPLVDRDTVYNAMPAMARVEENHQENYN